MKKELDILTEAMRLSYDDKAMASLFHKWNSWYEDQNPQEAIEEDTSFAASLKSLESVYESIDDTRFLDNVEQAVLSVASPAFVLTPEGMVLELNEMAADFFGVRQGAQCDLGFVQPQSMPDFEKIRQSARIKGNVNRAIIKVEQSGGEQGFAEVFTVSAKTTGPSLLAIRVLEIRWTDEVSDQLEQAFGLTVSELDVCRRFFATKNLDTVSKERDVSKRTISTQISQIFEKTGTNGQLELYGLLSSVCARLERSQSSDFQPWRDPYGREEIFTAPSGHRIAHSWIGAKQGRPILLVHGLSLGYAVRPEVDMLLRKAGIRLIAISRPNHGNSDPIKGKGAVDAGAIAIAELVDHLEVKPQVGIGLGPATAPLFEYAKQHPGQLRKIVSIGGYLPLSHPAFMKQQPAIHRANYLIASSAPWFAKILGRRFFGTINRRGYGQYLEMCYEKSPHDFDLIHRNEVRPLMLNSCSLMTAQGMDAFVGDLSMPFYDWIAEIDQLELEYTIFHGKHDPTARIEELLQISERYSNVHIEPPFNCGELLFYFDPMTVFRRVIELEKVPLNST